MEATIRQIHIKTKAFRSVSYDAIAKILRGDRRPSPELAKALEKATGIPRLCWLYPEEFPNPYLKNTSSKKNKRGQNGQT
jgi:transcriptional regulator with XRE-family HTH domain